MAQFNLAKLLTRDKEVSPLIGAVLDGMPGSLVIKDADGTLLVGHDISSQDERPIVLDGEVIGWVGGDEDASVVASIVTYIVNREVEKRGLARDGLDKYRELNLLYELSEKIGSSLQVETVATIAVNEVRRRIKQGNGFILIFDDPVGIFAPIVFSTEGFPFEAGVRLGEGIIGQIALSGQAEVVNEIDDDPRRSTLEGSFKSLVCAPLRARQRVIGVLGVSSMEPVVYTAADLKFLGTIASQVAPAIDNAMLYERTVQDAREREQQLQRQLAEMRIEVDEVRQSRQVAAITETDYFQALRRQANDLRKDLDPFA